MVVKTSNETLPQSQPPKSNNLNSRLLSTSSTEGHLRPPRTELQELSLEITCVQEVSANLEQQHRQLQEYTGSPLSPPSPIQQLPDDILQDIFIFCLPYDHYPILDSREAPLLLTQICARWRFLAMNMRRLWASVHIPIPVLRASSTRIRYSKVGRAKLKSRYALLAAAFVAAIGAWLGRTGQCPLSISLFQEDHQQEEEDACVRDVLTILVRHSARWKCLHVTAPLRNVGKLIERRSGDVPMLSTVSICSASRTAAMRPGSFAMFGQPNPSEPLLAWNSSSIFAAPRLESLSLYRLDEPILSIGVDWSKLTSLVIEEQGTFADFGFIVRNIVIDVPTVASILRQCWRLERCRMSLTPSAPDPRENDDSLSRPIELPLLTSFAFHEDRSCSVGLFRCLDVPALRKLEFQTLRKPCADVPSFSPIPLFLRQGHKLEEVVVDTQYMAPSDRLACWQHLPKLKKLDLCPSNFSTVQYRGDEQGLLPFTDYDLHHLLPSSNPRPVLPELRSFHCKTLSFISDWKILQFLRERRSSGLRHVSLAYVKEGGQAVDLASECHVLEADGMELLLEHQPTQIFVDPREGLKRRIMW